MPGFAGLGCDDPDHAVVGQRGNRVHQRVDQVAVAIAPPQQHDVDDFVRVLVEQVPTARLLDVSPDVVVGVFIPAHLLHTLIFFDAQFAGVVRGVRRRDHRRASSTSARSVRSALSSHAAERELLPGGPLAQYAASHSANAFVFESFSFETVALNSSGPELRAMAVATARAESIQPFKASRNCGDNGPDMLPATRSALCFRASTAGPALACTSAALSLNALT